MTPSESEKPSSAPHGARQQTFESHAHARIVQQLWVISCLLVVATLAVYWGVWRYEFVNFDDPLYVSQNPPVFGGLTAENIRWAFTTGHGGFWIPLTWLSLMADASCYGLNAGGYHVTNLLLHIANVLLLFAVLWQMTGTVWRSGTVAALFAIHPLHVESVAWVTERKDVLSLFFGLLAMLAYTRFCRKGEKRWYAFTLAAFGLSLMAKPMLVTLPFLLLLLDIWPLRRVNWLCTEKGRHDGAVDSRPASVDKLVDTPGSACPPRKWQMLVLEKVPLLLLGVTSSVVTLLAEDAFGALPTLESFSLSTRCCNAIVVYALYLYQMVWPVKLAVFYPHPGDAIPLVQVAGATALLLLLTVAAFVVAKRHPYVLIGWLWYLGTLVPMIGVIQVGFFRMADRFTYFPLVGLFVALVWLIPALLPDRPWRAPLLTIVASLVIVLLAVRAHTQTSYWENSETLLRRTIAATAPAPNPLALNNLGLALEDAERLNEAMEQFREAVRVDPDYHAAWNNLGASLYRKEQYAEALTYVQMSIRIDPNYAPAHHNQGMLLEKLGQSNNAILSYQQALAIKPDNAESHNSLAISLNSVGRRTEAMHHFQEAIRLKPTYAVAQYNFGRALSFAQQPRKAVTYFQNAIRINPNYVNARMQLGLVLLRLGQVDPAIEQFQKILEINPQHLPARQYLYDALARSRQNVPAGE
jgi:tetratricopeptide (TPR) repeat protein